MNPYLVIVGILALLLGGVLVAMMQQKKVSFPMRTLAALGMGIVLGTIVKFTIAGNAKALGELLDWYWLVGNGYIGFLKMITMPLIMVSIISAILKLKDGKNLGPMSLSVILVLVITAGVAATIGAGSALVFHLDASQIQQGQAETARAASLLGNATTANTPLADKLLEFVPSNPFKDMTGARTTSTLAVVIFSALVGIAALGIRKKYATEAETFQKIVDAAYAITMRLVGIILKMTPYGILAIMAATVAQTNYGAILNLGKFVLASYTALIIMFAIHLLILAAFRLNPLTYVRKAWPVLTFAFTSRTSMGTVPLTIECQNKKLGISEAIANFAATFGTTIGQNGCAGIYPAMLAVMIAPTMGINPLDPLWLAGLIGITALSSFGVAGVGGGATFAAIIVLSTMNLPIGLAGLLISIEPLIDMGRTALNVSDAFVAGSVTGRLLGEIDLGVYNSKDAELDQVQAG
jgi:L-cystine uptake protein TcyP (sodium:dicarboxylate symporter family)